jgi:uncharacterized repeat protein (TIGR01451 family)
MALRSVLAAVVAAGAWLAPAAIAGAQIEGDQSADRWVTIAARECDGYGDIRANLERNNLMESLEDLGADSLYESGQSIDPLKELVGQPTCRPITGWRFTFGDGVEGQVTGPWGALSVVSNPDGGQQPVTKESVPLRDWDGQPVGGAVKLAGAVTIGLNRDQVDRAEENSLWLQGGTPEDPALFGDPQFAGGYGFGALRCSIDNLYGNNVETIQFPSGTRHAFCFAYYVRPPAPTSGTIVIRKQVEGSEADETFRFSGNVSYDEGGVFDLSASEGDPGSIEFVRAETGAGDEPWTVVEDAREGWDLTGLSCASELGSTSATDLAARRVQITLLAGDTVTCTFTNRLRPPMGALVLRKVTLDGTGSFPFRVRDEDGDVVARRELTTTSPGAPGAVGVISLEPGRYRVSERRPATGEGVWRLSDVTCNGSDRDPGEPVVVNITAGGGAVCTFTNRLDRPGRINIRKVTIRGVGTAGFIVSPTGDPEVQRRQFATTRQPGVPARARGQSTRELPFGRYVIQETAISAGDAAVWSLIAVLCDGEIVPFEQGRATVRISRRTPVRKCTFVNLRESDPSPSPAPEPDPTPDPTPDPIPGETTPELDIDKQRTGSTGGPVPTLTFRLTVTNRADVTAKRVVVADRLAAGTVLVSARPSQGRCFLHGTRLLVCTLGDLEPGATARVRVRVQQVDPSAGLNVAIVGAGSPEDVLRDNVAAARFAAVRRPPSACPSSAGPIARAAC